MNFEITIDTVFYALLTVITGVSSFLLFMFSCFMALFFHGPVIDDEAVLNQRWHLEKERRKRRDRRRRRRARRE
ncbi:unnamed protein product [Caenorhabditis brenneri]